MKKIKNNGVGSLITYIGATVGADGKPTEREQVTFWGTGLATPTQPIGDGITDIDEKTLAEALKHPVVRSWFETGMLTEHIPLKMPQVTEAEPPAPIPAAQKSAEPIAEQKAASKK
jgi:hypothetical protein